MIEILWHSSGEHRELVVSFSGDERYPCEVSVVDVGDEADLRDEVSERQDNGGGDASKKEENFIVSLHGLPYSASLEDVANFLEGLHDLHVYYCW